MFVKLCDCASLCNVMIVKEKTKNGFFFYIYKDFFFFLLPYLSETAVDRWLRPETDKSINIQHQDLNYEYSEQKKIMNL